MRVHAVLMVLLAFLCAWLFSQQGDKSPPTFRITAERVVVDFVALDHQGRVLRDLRSEEIEILEDGKRQVAEMFLPPGSAAQIDLRRSAAPARPGEIPRGMATTLERERGLAGEGSLKTVIVIDSRAIDSNNFARSVSAVKSFVDLHLGANHSVMIAEINRGLRVLTPLTRDKQHLLATLNQLRPVEAYNPLDRSNNLTKAYFDQLQVQIAYFQEALTTLCYSLSGQRGRKHVVLFSEGYPLHPLQEAEMRMQSMVGHSRVSEVREAAAREVAKFKDPDVIGAIRQVTTIANKFGISFYTVDVRGLVAVSGVGSADRSGNVAPGPGGAERLSQQLGVSPELAQSLAAEQSAGQLISSFTLMDLRSLNDAQNSLVALAAATNGLAFSNSNNLGVVLRYSTLDQESYYLASYTPRTDRQRGAFHRIQVRCTRPGVRIRSRLGYLDIPLAEIRSARLSTAVERPELYEQLGPTVQVDAASGGARAILGIPAAQVEFRRNGTKWESEVTFRGFLYDSRGKAFSKGWVISKDFNLSLTTEEFEQIVNAPLLMSETLTLGPGEYRLVVVVEDRLAGTLGTAVSNFRVR